MRGSGLDFRGIAGHHRGRDARLSEVEVEVDKIMWGVILHGWLLVAVYLFRLDSAFLAVFQPLVAKTLITTYLKHAHGPHLQTLVISRINADGLHNVRDFTKPTTQ